MAPTEEMRSKKPLEEKPMNSAAPKAKQRRMKMVALAERMRKELKRWVDRR